MANPRLLIDHPLTAGAEIALTEAQARHVGLVLRLDAGDGLRVFNAEDGEWRARVAEKTKRGMRVAIEQKLRDARAAPDLDLLFAPVKRHATDLIVEKAAELGAARIRPVITQRTIAETVRTDRLSTIAREAAEQTERFDAPEILEPMPLFKALERWDEARPLLYADESGDEAGAAWGGQAGRAGPLLEVLGAIGGPSQLALLIGPEGGFTPEERRALRALSFVRPVSLGPRILRAETAVIAALTLIQAQWGDWRAA
ncbi:MAG TPA: 16S rRNA (uracil(1498)-N(3))-methyltransferase [Terricaulis sp.]|nr:16S rRNA (uracil(1498)-N(3))-methyltransferase [Terricaulis sp.]